VSTTICSVQESAIPYTGVQMVVFLVVVEIAVLVVTAGSASSWSEGVVSGIVAGSSEKKKDEGVGEVFMSLEPRLEGLTTSGFISFASFLLVAYQESTPTTEKKIINRGKNLRIFCFMLGIVPVEVEEVKL